MAKGPLAVVVPLVAILVLSPSCVGGAAPRPRSTSGTPGRTSPRGSPSGGSSSQPAGPPSLAQLDSLHVRLRKLVYIKDAVSLAWRPGDGTLYVADRPGRVWAVTGGRISPAPVLDISSLESFAGDRGLSGIAFSPDGSLLYVVYTDKRVDLRVDAFPFAGGRADQRRRRTVLDVPQPTIRHHGGDVHVTPDGDLWVALGDGDEDDPHGRSQKLDTLLGKLVRIHPTPFGPHPYTVPPDNPFVGRPHARPEIYAYGLRNPWRFSFDRATGDLWLGDVGQFAREEIDYLPAGQGAGSNFGWPRLEGTRPFRGTAPKDSVPPLYEYPHTGGRCAVVGGYVYRGSRIPALEGAYVYNDFCDGHIRALVQRGGRFEGERVLGPRLIGLASFGEGSDGELYALSLFNGVFELQP